MMMSSDFGDDVIKIGVFQNMVQVVHRKFRCDPNSRCMKVNDPQFVARCSSTTWKYTFELVWLFDHIYRLFSYQHIQKTEQKP